MKNNFQHIHLPVNIYLDNAVRITIFFFLTFLPVFVIMFGLEFLHHFCNFNVMRKVNIFQTNYGKDIKILWYVQQRH